MNADENAQHQLVFDPERFASVHEHTADITQERRPSFAKLPRKFASVAAAAALGFANPLAASARGQTRSSTPAVNQITSMAADTVTPTKVIHIFLFLYFPLEVICLVFYQPSFIWISIFATKKISNKIIYSLLL